MSDPEVAETPAAEVVVEAVPAAMALAPNAVGPTLGAELLVDPAAPPGVESVRAGLLQAGPLAVAGVVANGASVVLTVALARLLSPHSYGVLNQLTGLYLILSMPGSAVVVAVVRRVTVWHEDGTGHLVRRWAGRVHRQCTLVVLVWAVIVFSGRHGVAVLLNQQSGIGIAAILTAAAFFVLLSLDRGLLQAHRAYRPLAVNLLVEMGLRVIAVRGARRRRLRALRGGHRHPHRRGGGRDPRPLGGGAGVVGRGVAPAARMPGAGWRRSAPTCSSAASGPCAARS